MKFLILFLLISCSMSGKQPSRKLADDGEESKWGFLVLSDIHVYTTTSHGKKKIIPTHFQELVDKLEDYVDENNIKFIILLGDSTSGNENDNYSLKSVKHWWDELKISLTPLMNKGVKIYPIAGNHDYYTKNHQEGYRYGWCQLVKDSETCEDEHRYYFLNYKNVDLFFLHAVTYSMKEEQKKWLQEKAMKEKDNGHLKISFGHVALYTRLIAKPFTSFGDPVRKILNTGKINHYISGHEHYFWDEFIDGTIFRQTITGTSSGTYNYSPHITYLEKSCTKLNQDGQKICEMEPEKIKFLLSKKDKVQIYKQMFLHIKVDEASNSYMTVPMAFKESEIVPFAF